MYTQSSSLLSSGWSTRIWVLFWLWTLPVPRPGARCSNSCTWCFYLIFSVPIATSLVQATGDLQQPVAQCLPSPINLKLEYSAEAEALPYPSLQRALLWCRSGCHIWSCHARPFLVLLLRWPPACRATHFPTQPGILRSRLLICDVLFIH